MTMRQWERVLREARFWPSTSLVSPTLESVEVEALGGESGISTCAGKWRPQERQEKQ